MWISSCRAAGVLGAAALVLSLFSMGEPAGAQGSAGGSDARGGVSLEDRHLPTAVNAPGTWSRDEELRGPVAALGLATRTQVEGPFEETQSLELFAVSALDGSASWLRLPGFSLERWGFVGGFAVSPDGEWIGWVRPQEGGRRSVVTRVAGWSVMNTTTGQIRELDVPGFDWVRGTFSDLEFSGDSRHLLTSYETPDQPRTPRSRAHQLVAWDVEDGTPTVIEEPGRYFLPILGSAPSGVVWARGPKVYRVDPVGGEPTVVTLPQEVIAASWGPDDTSFAYLGPPEGKPKAPWRLYAGRTVAEARDRPVDLPPGVEADQLLGWRDATHVVIGHYRDSVDVVDIVTGEVETIDLGGYGKQANAPYLAAGLWQQTLLTPEPPDGTTDPRRPWQWASGLVLLLAAVFLVLWLRRRPTSQPRRAPTGHAVYPTGARPWKALSTAATGLVVVLIDLRFQGIDVIPDPLGWAMAALALGSLEAAHRGFKVAGVAAWVAAIASVPEWIGVQSALISVPIGLALLVVVFATCTAVMSVSPARAASATALRWLTLGSSSVLYVALAVASLDPSVGVVAFTAGAVGFVVHLWFLVLLYLVSKDAETIALEPAGA